MVMAAIMVVRNRRPCDIADRAARRRADGSADNGAGSRPQQPIVQTLAGHGRRSSDSDSEKKRQCE